jgi:hypothetical protein
MKNKRRTIWEKKETRRRGKERQERVIKKDEYDQRA